MSIRGSELQTVRARTSNRSCQAAIMEAAWGVMQDAYSRASGDGRFPVLPRQIMYAARPAILEKAGEMELDAEYFLRVLLPDYMDSRDCEDWNVASDTWGNFHEPHTGKKVPLGQYLGDIDSDRDDEAEFVTFPIVGPANRYSAVLLVDNEGFLPLFTEAKIAERYDIAIMSADDPSAPVVRELVDRVCGGHDIPLLVMHDFDVAGFSIVGDLQRDARRHSFTNEVEVVDIGLRLEDVDKYELQREPASTWARGERVELEAFTSPQLVAWLESTLELHGIGKVVPDDSTAEEAYRLALELSIVRARIRAIEEEAAQLAAVAALPADLRQQITSALDANRSQSWDEAVMSIAEADATSIRQ